MVSAEKEITKNWAKVGESMTDMIVGEVRTRYFGGVSNIGGQLGGLSSVDLGNDVWPDGLAVAGPGSSVFPEIDEFESHDATKNQI